MCACCCCTRTVRYLPYCTYSTGCESAAQCIVVQHLTVFCTRTLPIPVPVRYCTFILPFLLLRTVAAQDRRDATTVKHSCTTRTGGAWRGPAVFLATSTNSMETLNAPRRACPSLALQVTGYRYRVNPSPSLTARRLCVYRVQQDTR